jgi:glycerate kinase
MSEQDLHRTLGRLEQLAIDQNTRIIKLEMGQDDIKRTLQEAKGGWRVLMFIAGAAGGLGAAITAFLKGQSGT